MPFQFVRNDIIQMQVDAIVNTANPHPKVGAGVDMGIPLLPGRRPLRPEKMEILIPESQQLPPALICVHGM